MTEDTLPVGAYSITSFAQAHSIGRSSAYGEIAAGRLVARKFGSRTIVLAEDAAAWRSRLPKLQPSHAGIEAAR
jgi:hypothetical protein